MPIIAVIVATEKLAVAEKHKTALLRSREQRGLDPHVLETQVTVPRDVNGSNAA
jgi:hypothetical protein